MSGGILSGGVLSGGILSCHQVDQKEIIAAQDEVPDKVIDSSKPEQDLTITDLYKLIKHYGDKIDNINDNLAQSTHNDEILQTEQTDLKQKVNTQDDVIKLLTERLALQQTEITENRRDIVSSQAENRRHNLIFHGVQETATKAPHALVKEFLDDIWVPGGIEIVDTVYRIGPKLNDKRKTRRIFCKLSKKYDKGKVYKRLKDLKSNQKWAKVSVTISHLKRSVNGKASPLLCYLAKKNDIDAKVSGAALAIVVEGQRFTYKELDKLPHNLSLADPKQIPCKGGIAFQGPETYLSNLSKIPVEYRGREFKSNEHALVYTYAQVMGCVGIAARVHYTDCSYKAKPSPP